MIIFEIFLEFQYSDQSAHIESNAIKIEDLKDWLKCTGGPNQILSDRQLMFKTNFNVNTYSLPQQSDNLLFR